jgi:AraC family transcriptional regulator
MASLRSSRLLGGRLVQVFDVCCSTERSQFGASRSPDDVQIVLPRRGVFLVERRRAVTAVDTNTVLVLQSGEHYRFSHPVLGGHDSTIFVLPSDLLASAFGGKHRFQGMLSSRDQLVIHLIRRMLVDEATTQLEGEERCMFLLRTLAERVANVAATESRLGPGQRLRVQRARALLASDPTRSWSLASLARAVESSPFHLARQFRSVTGETISRYLLRLRLAIAVERLAEGEGNLMKLACELGFAHHSHFGARFRSVFDATPSQVRAALAGGSGQDLFGSVVGAAAYTSAG